MAKISNRPTREDIAALLDLCNFRKKDISIPNLSFFQDNVVALVELQGKLKEIPCLKQFVHSRGYSLRQFQTFALLRRITSYMQLVRSFSFDGFAREYAAKFSNDQDFISANVADTILFTYPMLRVYNASEQMQ